jgi:hypothetical protein
MYMMLHDLVRNMQSISHGTVIICQVDFYRERRLRPMLKYANDSEMSRLGDVLMRNLDSLFDGIEVYTRACRTRTQLVPSYARRTTAQHGQCADGAGCSCRSSRLCCMATYGPATLVQQTGSLPCTTLQCIMATTRYQFTAPHLALWRRQCMKLLRGIVSSNCKPLCCPR